VNGPEKIRAAGWRQGSVIDRHSASEKFKNLLEGKPPELTHWLVLTQDCDLINDSYEKEPEIELLGCKIVAAVDGNLTHGKNPRRIHLPALIGNCTVVLEARVFQRFCFPRPALEDFPPTEGCSTSVEEIRMLAEWVARRYTRSAFPDEFNRRIKKAHIGFKKVLADHGTVISGVWVALNTYSELAAGEAYRIGVRVTVTAEDYQEAAKRDEANMVVNSLELGFADCEGIEVVRADFVSESDFSLSDVRLSARFDAYDYLSSVETD
jgi:hypothetical protein